VLARLLRRGVRGLGDRVERQRVTAPGKDDGDQQKK
jgi:hypothetical protein